MDVGYLPDMFGHIAQMPQILRLGGFRDAVVWRGVPSQVTKNAFVWEAPDGSSVRAEYLPVGYGNGAALPDDAKALVRRTEDNVAEVADSSPGDLLCMNGSDHLMPQPWLGRVVAEANDLQDEFHFEVTSLPQYLAGPPHRRPDAWCEGELRSGFRSNMLMGVTSNRVDVKRLGALAERELERRAEPLCALFQAAGGLPGPAPRAGLARDGAQLGPRLHLRLLGRRRRRRRPAPLRRGARHRHRSGRPGGQGLRPLAGGARAYRAQPVAAGPLRRRRAGRAGRRAGARPTCRCSRSGPGCPGSMVLDADTVRTVLGMMQGPRISDDAWIHDVRIEDTDEGIDITIAVGTEEKPDVPIAEAKQDVYTRLGARPDAVVRVGHGPAVDRQIVARTAEVPGYGWRRLRGRRRWHTRSRSARPRAPVVLSNGLVTVEIDKASGTFALDGMAGYGRLVDGGDLGDSYNYSPPRQDSFVDTPDVRRGRGSTSAGRCGPGPASPPPTPGPTTWTAPRRPGWASTRSTSRPTWSCGPTTPRSGSPRSFVNPSGDHRLRVHLPLPEPAAHSRGRERLHRRHPRPDRRGRADEFGLPTAPANRFVTAGRLTVAHEGVCEYELIDVEGDGGARRWRSRCCARPACCRGSAWPTGPSRPVR